MKSNRKVTMALIYSFIAVIAGLSSVSSHATDCRVTKLIDDQFFDTALEEYGKGDEDYTSVLYRIRKGKKYLKVGGLYFPKNSTQKVTEFRRGNFSYVSMIQNRLVQFTLLMDGKTSQGYLLRGNGFETSEKIAVLKCSR